VDQPRSALLRLLDRWVIPTMVFVVVMFALFVAWTVVETTRSFDPIRFGPQAIERIEDDGTVTVPRIAGIDGPALYLSDRVPTRGAVTNTHNRPVSVAGSILWVEQPPGLRVIAGRDLPGLLPPGTEQIRFENRIPAEIVEFVDETGPSRWFISGVVDVLSPGGVSTTWQTATFTLVPDGWEP
jgi:hypothetical protein